MLCDVSESKKFKMTSSQTENTYISHLSQPIYSVAILMLAELAHPSVRMSQRHEKLVEPLEVDE